MQFTATRQAINPLTPRLTRPAADIMGTAKKFEAVLLESLFDSLEKTFAAIPGSQTDQASDTYHYLGTQALAGTLANAGGFGIARMIAKQLLHKGISSTRPEGNAKVPDPAADRTDRR